MRTISKITKGAPILPLFLLCMFLVACGAGEETWDYHLTGTWSTYGTDSIKEEIQDEDWRYIEDRIIIHEGNTLSFYSACSTINRYDLSLSGNNLSLAWAPESLTTMVGTVSADGTEMEGYYFQQSGNKKSSGNWKMVRESGSTDYRTYGSLEIETLNDVDVVIEGENCGNISLDSAYVCVDGLGEEGNPPIVITSAHIYQWLKTEEPAETEEAPEVDEKVEIEGELSLVIKVPWLLESGKTLDIEGIRNAPPPSTPFPDPITLKGDLIEDCSGEREVDALRGTVTVVYYDYDNKELRGEFEVELTGGSQINGRFDIYSD